MALYISQAAVRRWGDRQAVSEGTACFARGGVGELEVEGDRVRATVTLGGRPVRTRFRVLPDATVDSECPCPQARERGLICVHVVAAGLLLADQTEDPARERADRLAARRRREDQEGPTPGRVQRRPAGASGSVPATLRLRLDTGLTEGWEQDRLTLTAQVLYQDQKRRLDKVSPDLPLAFSARDTDLLYVWEDLGGEVLAPGSLNLTREQMLELLQALAPGELARLEGGVALRVEPQPLIPLLTLSLNTERGTLLLHHRLDTTPLATLPGRRQAWVLLPEDRLHPLDAVLPAALGEAYRPEGAEISRTQVLSFLRLTLPALEQRFLVDADVDRSLFVFEPGQPAFALDLDGTAESLHITLLAIYGEVRVRATARLPEAEAGYPLPGRPLVFATRNTEAEAEALAWVGGLAPLIREGDGLQSVTGAEAVLTVIEEVLPVARQRGWQVNGLGVMARLLGEADWIRPCVTIAPAAAPGWFDVQIVYRDPRGEALDPAFVEAALTPGTRATPGREGRLLLANRALLRALRLACQECLSDPEAVQGRISEVHAGYFASLLDAHPGITLSAHDDWHAQVRRQNQRLGLDPVALPEPLGSQLRPYQREGVAWLRFLEKGGYAGLLADEMGLGKTLQALAWLQLERLSATARGLPSLVVCPTSLLENWAREAARFTPALRVRVVAGADRHRDADTGGGAMHDLLITSYALLRRDIGRYATQSFAAVVLDEAQHIKNRATQNAQAARQLKAVHRLVLTGTPVENAVGDLWSMFEFLMPGYLGSEARFQASFERPIRAGGRAAEDALLRLRAKIQPFLLRRLKTAVAADLPPRLTRTATCVMGPQQSALYRALVEDSRASLEAAVASRGFEASRMTVLKTLLRLRQCCCHPALLPGGEASADAVPSAKLELFFELLDEARDGGQRVLVFSQFVTMLGLLRRELEARDIPYAYLDGSTRNRQAEVDRFQQDDACPLFLISLKAGGSGLNLTGANVVIHFDPWWNPAVEDQATDRAHRIGQTRSVYSIKLVTAGTVEERVLALQDRKRQVIDAAIGSPGAGPAGLSWTDVQQLLAL